MMLRSQANFRVSNSILGPRGVHPLQGKEGRCVLLVSQIFHAVWNEKVEFANNTDREFANCASMPGGDGFNHSKVPRFDWAPRFLELICLGRKGFPWFAWSAFVDNTVIEWHAVGDNATHCLVKESPGHIANLNLVWLGDRKVSSVNDVCASVGVGRKSGMAEPQAEMWARLGIDFNGEFCEVLYDTIQSERVPPGYPMRIRKFTFYDLEYFLIAATNFHVNLYLWGTPGSLSR